jgi:anaerobic ribonucleoside-triphosphate reductase activating protein
MYMADEVYLNISKTLSHSRANGPGVRAVVWVQGCTVGCEGCYSTATHPHKRVNLIEPKHLANWIATLEGIEGITFSGGEPFEQAEAVLSVILLTKSLRPDLTIFLFSGFEYQNLKSSKHPAVTSILESADMLSTGPFVADRFNPELLWRGSENQQLIYLSEVYSSGLESEWKTASPIEEIQMNSTRLDYTGFKGKDGLIYNHLKGLSLVDD